MQAAIYMDHTTKIHPLPTLSKAPPRTWRPGTRAPSSSVSLHQRPQDEPTALSAARCGLPRRRVNLEVCLHSGLLQVAPPLLLCHAKAKTRTWRGRSHRVASLSSLASPSSAALALRLRSADSWPSLARDAALSLALSPGRCFRCRRNSARLSSYRFDRTETEPLQTSEGACSLSSTTLCKTSAS